MKAKNNTCGIYIHVPFCISKCHYCDFLSFDIKDEEKYVQHLINDIKSWDFSDQSIDTVYIGGGTPTVLPSYLLCKILDAVQTLPLINNVEITVEANPGTLSLEYLKEIKAVGVNRLSLGLQSTHTRLLKTIGRKSSGFKTFLQNIEDGKKAGFKNINIDLMFGLPSQSFKEWESTLKDIVSINPQHISAYSLTPAEGTVLYDQLNKGILALPSDELDRKMYHFAREFLSSEGYGQYELSNFTQNGFESKHNVNCWSRVPYIAFGLGAHSFDGKSRWCNEDKMDKYLSLNKYTKKDEYSLTPEDAYSEEIILGLRLIKGVKENMFKGEYLIAANKLISDGLLEIYEGNLRMTPRGMDLANIVFGKFL